MALRTPLSVTPHLYMGDSTGRPLDMGTVYFGEPDKDPEFYPINLFSDDALTLPLAQPVHTKGGYLYDKGDMVEPHAKELIYSVKVLDSYGRKVFYKGAMMRNSWNDDVIEQINTAIIGSADVARQVATDITNDAINNTAIDGGILADTFVTVTANGVGSVARTQRDKNSERVSVKDFGANSALLDNRDAFQNAFDSLNHGDTLIIPDGDFTIINATGNGANIFAQRLDAVANNTLYPIECDKDNIKVVIEGTVRPTSILGDLFIFRGKDVRVVGRGSIIGTGDTNDFNSGAVGADKDKQWYASLVTTTGVRAYINGLTFISPPSTCVRVHGRNSKITGNFFSGGRMEHGTGTNLFHIHIRGAAHYTSVVDNTFDVDELEHAAYSDVFSEANYCTIANNIMSGGLEHGVYSYGKNCLIMGNMIYAAKKAVAAGIQVFNSDNIITGNIIDKYLLESGVQVPTGTGILAQKADRVKIVDNNIRGTKTSGIVINDLYNVDASTPMYEDVVVSGNYVEGKGAQTLIKLITAVGYKNLKVLNNTFEWEAVEGTGAQYCLHLITLTTYNKVSDNVEVQGNRVSGAKDIPILISGVRQLKFNNNTVTNPNFLRFITLHNCNGIDMIGNTFEDTRELASKQAKTVGSFTGCSGLNFSRNNLNGFIKDPAISPLLLPTGHIGTNYDNSADGDDSVGVFLATDLIGSAVSISSALVRRYSGINLRIEVIPLNTTAEAIQNSASKIIFSSLDMMPDNANGKIIFKTSDNLSLSPEAIGEGANVAKFMYKIIM